MNDENPFSALYAKLHDEKLFQILKRPFDYDPKAIEAAKMEMDSRGLEKELRDLQVEEPKAISFKPFFSRFDLGPKVKYPDRRKSLAPIIDVLDATHEKKEPLVKRFLLREIGVIFLILYSLSGLSGIFAITQIYLPHYGWKSILYITIVLLLNIAKVVAVILFIKKYRVAWYLMIILALMGLEYNAHSAYDLVKYGPDASTILVIPWVIITLVGFAIYGFTLFQLLQIRTKRIYSISDTLVKRTLIAAVIWIFALQWWLRDVGTSMLYYQADYDSEEEEFEETNPELQKWYWQD